jgi:hypothetical protein
MEFQYFCNGSKQLENLERIRGSGQLVIKNLTSGILST